MCEARNFYIWFLQVLVLTAVLIVLLWFLLPPRSPTYTIIDFYVPAFNDTMNSTITFRLEIQNPNKDYSISCDETKVTLYYGNNSLGGTRFPMIVDLNQGKIVENGNVNAERELLQKAVSGAVWNGTMELRMGLVSGVKYKMWFWKSKHHGIEMEGHVPVGKDGKISNKKKKLKLHRVHKKFLPCVHRKFKI